MTGAELLDKFLVTRSNVSILPASRRKEEFKKELAELKEELLDRLANYDMIVDNEELNV